MVVATAGGAAVVALWFRGVTVCAVLVVVKGTVLKGDDVVVVVVV